MRRILCISIIIILLYKKKKKKTINDITRNDLTHHVKFTLRAK